MISVWEGRMKKLKKDSIEFRYYEIPQGTQVLALLGEKWITSYGKDPMHFHNYFEMGYCYSGNGTMYFGDASVPYKTGDVIVVPKNHPHRTQGVDNGIQRWEYMYVDTETLFGEQYKDQPGMAERLLRRLHERMFVITEEDDPTIAKRMIMILDEFRRKQELYQDVVKGEVMALLLSIIRLNQTGVAIKPVTSHNRCLEDILGVVKYIEEHYQEDLHIEDLVKLSYMSETHFRRKFNEYMNITPADYINLLRVKKACELMRTSDCSISSAGIQAGFQTDSAFIRNFRKFVGVTPREWRKESGQKIDNLMNYNISVLKGW